ncbi:hypothetical protein Cgig2_002191 [Carnegiea gigantea]|uniref:Ribosomal protein L35A n=1 Tax=Carnegiea gigantea TaxID=171969 RepID=A0A9Q1KT86_9CARY|nr:hypothetical protein Cgig2_002191 [Carnegiea gigantea]
MVKGRQGERVRLYVRGSILGYKRSKSNQYPNTSLVQIEGVNTQEEVSWYLGKKLAYIYKAKIKKNGSHYRCIWGKVCRPHGNSGVVRAKFKSNLPPKSMGAKYCVELNVLDWPGVYTSVLSGRWEKHKVDVEKLQLMPPSCFCIWSYALIILRVLSSVSTIVVILSCVDASVVTMALKVRDPVHHKWEISTHEINALRPKLGET